MYTSGNMIPILGYTKFFFFHLNSIFVTFMCYVGIINITLINVSLELDVCSMTFILKLFSRFILELYVLVNVKISRCLIVHFLWRSPLIFWIKSLLIRISGLTLHYYTVSVYSSYSPSTLNKGFTRLNFVKSCQKLS